MSIDYGRLHDQTRLDHARLVQLWNYHSVQRQLNDPLYEETSWIEASDYDDDEEDDS